MNLLKIEPFVNERILSAVQQILKYHNSDLKLGTLIIEVFRLKPTGKCISDEVF